MIYVATYVTDADLEDLRDSVRDADLEFIASFPCAVSHTRSDAVLTALHCLRADHLEISDTHDPQATDLLLEIDDEASPRASSLHHVHYFGDRWALISVRAFDL